MTDPQKNSTGHNGGWIPAGPAILFTPADRSDRFAKAAERADMVILDLEDGCRPENRASARAGIIDNPLDPERTIIRINPADSPEHAADLEMLAQTQYSLVMLPKAESSAAVEALAGYKVIALIETPLGVLRADDIATASNVVSLFWGAEDLVAGLGGTSSRFQDNEAVDNTIIPGTYRDVARHARARTQLAAAAFGHAALDSVHVDIKDEAGLRSEALDAAALGYAATVCIHPSQVAIIRDAYRPTDEQADWARRLLAEAEHNQGAFSFEGRMVDAPLFRQAEAIARRAAATT
ncbi:MULTISPECIES: HpcH/HpaI aldolase/citrate lyase family protein [unclassified Corynebacterium]|uniref:HpcH/HpaI aldolase/citrate lyase family protein n=1 Tax=unclassified Corynebacterium TaxID=2624378 RepID=UPI00309E914F